MCVEYVSVALCAPTTAPSLSFTCGQLHLVAGHREVCQKAKGSCICFFATCSTITQSAGPQAMDWKNVPKIRCLACTKREDHIGAARSHRELLESPLLSRSAVLPSERDSSVEFVRGLWKGADVCPFHTAVKHDHDDKENVRPWDSEPPAKRFSAADEQFQAARLWNIANHSNELAPPFDAGDYKATRPHNIASHTDELAPTFVPRPRRPIPIVKPASTHNSPSPRGRSPAAVPVELPTAPETSPSVNEPVGESIHEKVTETVNDSITENIDKSVIEAINEKWVPPHLRHRVIEPCHT